MLDLDETLVHCTVDPIANPDHRFEVHFNGEEFQVSGSNRFRGVCVFFVACLFTCSAGILFRLKIMYVMSALSAQGSAAGFRRFCGVLVSGCTSAQVCVV